MVCGCFGSGPWGRADGQGVGPACRLGQGPRQLRVRSPGPRAAPRERPSRAERNPRLNGRVRRPPLAQVSALAVRRDRVRLRTHAPCPRSRLSAHSSSPLSVQYVQSVHTVSSGAPPQTVQSDRSVRSAHTVWSVCCACSVRLSGSSRLSWRQSVCPVLWLGRPHCPCGPGTASARDTSRSPVESPVGQARGARRGRGWLF